MYALFSILGPISAGHSAFCPPKPIYPQNRLLRNNVKLEKSTAFPTLGKALRNERRKRRREGKADDRGWKKGCFVLVFFKKNKNTLSLFLRHSCLIRVFYPLSSKAAIFNGFGTKTV